MTIQSFLKELREKYPTVTFRSQHDLILCRVDFGRKWHTLCDRVAATGPSDEFHHLVEAAIDDHNHQQTYVLLVEGQMLVTPYLIDALRYYDEGHAYKLHPDGEWQSRNLDSKGILHDYLKIKSPLNREEIEDLASFARRTGQSVMTNVDTVEERRAAYAKGADRVYWR